MVNYGYETKYLNKDIHEKATSFIKEKKTYLKYNIDMYKYTLNSISNNLIFKNYIEEQKNKDEVVSLFEQIISSDRNIMQIRYLDKNGQEVIRVNRDVKQDAVYVTKDKDLQNKANRYYFKETIVNSNKLFWYSKLDVGWKILPNNPIFY